MQKETRYNFTAVHLNLLQQFENLFNRQNLCSNNYLYRQMNQNFQIPISIIVEERKIAQISNNIQIIQESLQMCNLIELIDKKIVRIHDFPTLKFNIQHRKQIKQIVTILKENNKKTITYQQDNQIFLSVIQRNYLKQFQNFVNNYNINLQYKISDLHNDLKVGTAKIRKLKQQNKKNNKNQKYSLDKPPAIFIRKAIQSSQDQQQKNIQKKNTKIKKQNSKDKQKKQQKEKEKKYRQKPLINEQDFPSLC